MAEISREVIVTPRLRLITITPEMLEAELAGDGRLGELIGCRVPENWPPDDWEPHVFEFCLRQFRDHPEQIGWHRYVSWAAPDGCRWLIGCVGASSKDESPWMCEIGYSIRPPYDGRGFATEGTRALIEYLRGDERLERVIAHTFPSIPGSIRVMEKCGMVFDGEGDEAGTVRYRLDLRALSLRAEQQIPAG